jgi:hypothetical protein
LNLLDPSSRSTSMTSELLAPLFFRTKENSVCGVFWLRKVSKNEATSPARARVRISGRFRSDTRYPNQPNDQVIIQFARVGVLNLLVERAENNNA